MKKYISEDDEVNDDTNGHTNRWGGRTDTRRMKKKLILGK